MKRSGQLWRTAPLAPGGPLRCRTELARTGLQRTVPLQQGAGIRRTSRLDAKPYRPPAGFPDSVKRAAFARDGEVCVPGITCGHTRESLVGHHRCNRGIGGSKAPWVNAVTNSLTVCARCNDALDHDARDDSWYEKGWKVHRGIGLPAAVPVLYPDGSWWLLLDDGTREQVAA